MSPALLALAMAMAAPPAGSAGALAEAAHALEAGRTGQARDMIELAVARGEHGLAIDRLLARLALSERRDAEALAGFRDILRRLPNDPAALLGAATAATRLGHDGEALALATTAARLPGAGWAPFNLLGVLADRRGDRTAAEQAYAQALRRGPEQPVVLNNAGWSALCRGEWAQAEGLFAKATAKDPANPVIANNLELVRAILADRLPERRRNESDDAFAARLNDAGVAARMAGDERRATAAFSRAVEVRGRWYERAYNNLLAGRTASR